MQDSDRVFRSGSAARWLPRAMAAAVMVLAGVAAGRVPDGEDLFAYFKVAYLLLGAFGAFQILRAGTEVRVEVREDGDRIWVGAGSHQGEMEYAKIERLEYDSPFARSMRAWLPATALVDDLGRSFRLPATLDQGDLLLERILARSDKSELRTWAETLQLPARMSRPGRVVAVGYAAVVAVLIVAAAYGLR